MKKLFLICFIGLISLSILGMNATTKSTQNFQIGEEHKKNITVYRFLHDSQKNNGGQGTDRDWDSVIRQMDYYYYMTSYGKMRIKKREYKKWKKIPESPCEMGYKNWLDTMVKKTGWKEKKDEHAVFYMPIDCWKKNKDGSLYLVNGKPKHDKTAIARTRDINSGGSWAVFQRTKKHASDVVVSGPTGIHELGHNLGLLHSDSIECKVSDWANEETFNGNESKTNNCKRKFYGDMQSMMGYYMNLTLPLDAVHMRELQFAPGIFQHVKEGNKKYTIRSRNEGLELATTDLQSKWRTTQLNKLANQKRIIEIKDPASRALYYLEYVSNQNNRAYQNRKGKIPVERGVFLRQSIPKGIKKGHVSGYRGSSIIFDTYPGNSREAKMQSALVPGKRYVIANGRIAVTSYAFDKNSDTTEIKVEILFKSKEATKKEASYKKQDKGNKTTEDRKKINKSVAQKPVKEKSTKNSFVIRSEGANKKPSSYSSQEEEAFEEKQRLKEVEKTKKYPQEEKKQKETTIEPSIANTKVKKENGSEPTPKPVTNFQNSVSKNKSPSANSSIDEDKTIVENISNDFFNINNSSAELAILEEIKQEKNYVMKKTNENTRKNVLYIFIIASLFTLIGTIGNIELIKKNKK